MLPAELLQGISKSDGKVVLVVGAGCSSEDPTGLPQSKELAKEAFRQLIADGELVESDCDDPGDLSSLADTVYAMKGSQTPLVRRFPLTAFERAEPNDGYLIAAALLREQAIRCVLTLNFDLALPNALGRLGAEDVATIYAPSDIGKLSTINVVFLHRSVRADPDDWVLRRSQLVEEWGDWETVITNHVLVAPHVVFAGLGSAAGVLVDTVGRLRGVLEDSSIYQVDPSPQTANDFSAELQVEAENYVEMAWGEFMDELGGRVVVEHINDIEAAGQVLINEEEIDGNHFETTLMRAGDLGLVDLGRMRASWTFESGYQPHRSVNPAHLADLLLGVCLLERLMDAEAVFTPEGVVELTSGDGSVATVIVGSGCGARGWLALEPLLLQRQTDLARSSRRKVTAALVAGLRDARPTNIAPPSNITGEPKADSISSIEPLLDIKTVEELRSNPDLWMEWAR